MNQQKLNRLFESARRDPPPALSDDLASRVLLEVGREPQIASVFDQLQAMFPRLALAALVVIALCIAGELASSQPSLSERAARLSDQWMFAAR